jgi:hypothetical protein
LRETVFHISDLVQYGEIARHVLGGHLVLVEEHPQDPLPDLFFAVVLHRLVRKEID